MPGCGDDGCSSFPKNSDEAVLRAEILDTIRKLGHTNPTNISIDHLASNYFPTRDVEGTLRPCIDNMVKIGDPIEYADRSEEIVHVTDASKASEIYSNTMDEVYEL